MQKHRVFQHQTVPQGLGGAYREESAKTGVFCSNTQATYAKTLGFGSPDCASGARGGSTRKNQQKLGFSAADIFRHFLTFSDIFF